MMKGTCDKAATITHNANLSFEIGTCHNNTRTSSGNNERNKIDDSSARVLNEDQNGKSEDKSHGENHSNRAGYSYSSTFDEGKPFGIRPVNNCANRIQVKQSKDYSPGDEAIWQPVSVDGKPGGISHSHRKSIIAEPTPVLVIHPEVILWILTPKRRLIL